jgi:hypothetical protein
MQANELRGEVDIELDGQKFVLRPSYAAILEVEQKTGKSLIKLATMAGDGDLSLTDTAIVVTAFIQAWGKAVDNSQAEGANASRIGELIQEYGLMQVQLRLTFALSLAATGGCKADGTRKDDSEGEPTATGKRKKTSATPVAASQE